MYDGSRPKAAEQGTEHEESKFGTTSKFPEELYPSRKGEYSVAIVFSCSFGLTTNDSQSGDTQGS